MIAILVCGQDPQERMLIEENCRRHVAHNGNESVRLESVADDQALSAVQTREKLVDLLYYSFRKGQPLYALQAFRRCYSETMVMLITDSTVSPLEYLRPGVAPDSLLLRPLEREQLERINAEFMESFFENVHQKKSVASFVVDTREERVFIPYSQIYYFEARDKKLFVRVKNEEYAFYDTIESLETRLPDMFRRCHRSYIVNIDKIARIRAAENLIELSGGQLGVPISRNYKARFKEAWT